MTLICEIGAPFDGLGKVYKGELLLIAAEVPKVKEYAEFQLQQLYRWYREREHAPLAAAYWGTARQASRLGYRPVHYPVALLLLVSDEAGELTCQELDSMFKAGH